jgi:hypothetical protein
MEAFPSDNYYLKEECGGSVWRKQGDFVAFLVDTYYVEPSRIIEEERLSGLSGVFSCLPYRRFSFGNDVAKIIGRIAEEALLLNQKHVQDKPPFSILEKPLAVPAMIGSLLQHYFFEEHGIFVSSITFDSWASRALGFEIRLTRAWLSAEFHVQQALLNTSAKRLVTARGALDAGTHAIALLSRKGAPLHSLWIDACSLLSTKCNTRRCRPETKEAYFEEAMKEALALREIVDKALKCANPLDYAACHILYSTAEPELCACVTYYACFRRFELLFGDTVTSRDEKAASASLMKDFFHGCINCFTFNRYNHKKATSLFGTLDAVGVLAEKRHLTSQQSLKLVSTPSPPTYLQRTQPLSCDHISGSIISSFLQKVCQPVSHHSVTFSEMDTSAMNVRTMYSFVLGEHNNCNGNDDHETTAQENGFMSLRNADWVDYSLFTDVKLKTSDADCGRYVLNETERNAKTLVYAKLHGHKRPRAA